MLKNTLISSALLPLSERRKAFGGKGLMKIQPWKTSVEIEEIEDRHYVRIIEDGAVSIKGFGSRADAKNFAQRERARHGLDVPSKE